MPDIVQDCSEYFDFKVKALNKLEYIISPDPKYVMRTSDSSFAMIFLDPPLSSKLENVVTVTLEIIAGRIMCMIRSHSR